MLLKWEKVVQKNRRTMGGLEGIKEINQRKEELAHQNTNREEGINIFVSENTPMRKFRSRQTNWNIFLSQSNGPVGG